MRIVLQRVKKASVVVDGKIVSEIGKGLLVLLGAEKGDTEALADYLAKKIVNLRIFPDENDKMNLSIKDVVGEVLVVSQFTLASYIKKGNRPSFSDALEEKIAEKLYEKFVDNIKSEGLRVRKGVFKARMEVSLVNDGPVTFILERRANS
ncbi:MAG: D-tyrosyl-tRNA(Tyr) deacylase, partial [Caldiserica bacterium]|nr:D-tyrosyl-tRNA(Tyr) deacylase [Caldisericota bacterium]